MRSVSTEKTLNQRIGNPTRQFYNAILNDSMKNCQPTGSAVDNVEEIVTMILAVSDEGPIPAIVTYSTVKEMVVQSAVRGHRVELTSFFLFWGRYLIMLETNRDNQVLVLFSPVFQAWAKMATPEGAFKSENLLRRNIASQEEGFANAKPHIIMKNGCDCKGVATQHLASGPKKF